MSSSEKQGSSMIFASFLRSMSSFRYDQIDSIECSPTKHVQDSELELFQQDVSNRFHELSGVDTDEFLTLSWLMNLLHAFIVCQEKFKIIICKNKEILSQQPQLDKFLFEFSDRSIKALDICNASRDGIGKIREWQKNLDIIVCALDCREDRVVGEAQFLRARKALLELALVTRDEKETRSMFSSHRSFGRVRKNKDHRRQHSDSGRHSRSLSYNVPDSWSASKQIQSIANNLVPPRGNELALTIFTMSFVLTFVLWTLVAALPCQDRAQPINFTIPRQFSWSASFQILQNRILNESRKSENKDSSCLLKEIFQMERSVQRMTDLVDAAHFPLTEEQKDEVVVCVLELGIVCEVFKSWLAPLDRQLKDVFRCIISCRAEGLQLSGMVLSGAFNC